MAKPKDDIRALGTALADFRVRLKAIDERIDGLIVERHLILGHSVTREEAIAALDIELDALSVAGREVIDGAVATLARGGRGAVATLLPREVDITGRLDPGHQAALFHLLRDEIRAGLVDQVKTSAAFDDDAMPLEERRERVDAIDAEVVQLEREHAELVALLREAGFTVNRRDREYTDVPHRTGPTSRTMPEHPRRDQDSVNDDKNDDVSAPRLADADVGDVRREG